MFKQNSTLKFFHVASRPPPVLTSHLSVWEPLLKRVTCLLAIWYLCFHFSTLVRNINTKLVIQSTSVHVTMFHTDPLFSSIFTLFLFKFSFLTLPVSFTVFRFFHQLILLYCRYFYPVFSIPFIISLTTPVYCMH